MSFTPGEESAQYQYRPYEQSHAQGLPIPAPPMQPANGQGLTYHHVQPHSAILAVVASFFIPGLGSMLNEKVGKGIGILVAYIVSAVLIIFLVGFIAAPAVWIWGMVAANNDAHKWNRTHGILS
jgi:TM2 domain-containing membrane protein YozV